MRHTLRKVQARRSGFSQAEKTSQMYVSNVQGQNLSGDKTSKINLYLSGKSLPQIELEFLVIFPSHK